jgi:hypothetical protein
MVVRGKQLHAVGAGMEEAKPLRQPLGAVRLIDDDEPAPLGGDTAEDERQRVPGEPGPACAFLEEPASVLQEARSCGAQSVPAAASSLCLRRAALA